jgi:hypothetical protein
MTERDDLTESLRHLEYEMAMIVAAPRMLAKHQLTPAKNTDRPDGYYWANDRAVAYLTAIESALAHARLLDDFFKRASTDPPPQGHKADDRYAAEYCVENGWRRFRLMTKDEHLTIDRQLSHFTTYRQPREGHDLGKFAQKAVDALMLLTRRADPQWRDRLEEILAKVLAERARANETWNSESTSLTAESAPGLPCIARAVRRFLLGIGRA